MLPEAYQMENFSDVDRQADLARNHVMAKNILNALKIYPKAEVMLVFVGEAHLPGMTEILLEKYGFQQTPLETTLDGGP